MVFYNNYLAKIDKLFCVSYSLPQRKKNKEKNLFSVCCYSLNTPNHLSVQSKPFALKASNILSTNLGLISP